MNRKFRLGFAIVQLLSGVVAIIFRLCSEKNGVTISSPELFDIIIIMWAVTGLSEIEEICCKKYLAKKLLLAFCIFLTMFAGVSSIKILASNGSGDEAMVALAIVAIVWMVFLLVECFKRYIELTRESKTGVPD